MKKTLLLSMAIACCKMISAQVYLEPFAGYIKDLNNKKFQLLNTGVQLSYVKGRRYEMILQLQKSWPTGGRSSDSSFTLNPNLPLYSPAAKQLRPSSITAAFGNRFKILGSNSKNAIYAKVFTGIVYQRVSVRYQYDKNNYIILNPDKTLQAAGIFLSGGLEYMRQLPTGRLFGELNFSTPPATGKLNYPYSFNSMAPFSINIGYSILLKKK
jgi:hypothetical protein